MPDSLLQGHLHASCVTHRLTTASLPLRRRCLYPHFTGKETEAEKFEELPPGSLTLTKVRYSDLNSFKANDL